MTKLKGSMTALLRGGRRPSLSQAGRADRIVFILFFKNWLDFPTNRKHDPRIPPRSKRGVSADRHDTWSAGCGGRLGDARDSFVRTNGTEADAKACGPGLPTLRSSRAR